MRAATLHPGFRFAQAGLQAARLNRELIHTHDHAANKVRNSRHAELRRRSIFRRCWLPGLPAPAVKWAGFPKYNFVGGHNDAEQVPVDDLIAAASAVLRREGAQPCDRTGSTAARSAIAGCANF